MNTKISSVGRCPICGQGDVIIVKERISNELLLICDDCESQWLNPLDFLEGDNPIKNEKNNLDDQVSNDEIIAAGWDKYVKSYL